jgi:hypothetical protein
MLGRRPDVPAVTGRLISSRPDRPGSLQTGRHVADYLGLGALLHCGRVKAAGLSNPAPYGGPLGPGLNLPGPSAEVRAGTPQPNMAALTVSARRVQVRSLFVTAPPRAPLPAGLAATQRPPGLYTERPWRRTAGLDPGSVRRLDNEGGRVAFHCADQ